MSGLEEYINSTATPIPIHRYMYMHTYMYLKDILTHKKWLWDGKPRVRPLGRKLGPNLCSHFLQELQEK